MSRKVIAVIAAAFTIIAVVFLWSRSGPETDKYKYARVRRGSVLEIVSETGNLSPDATSRVFSAANGQVEEIFVRNGEMVDAGDDLFRVENEATGDEMTTVAPIDGKVANLSITPGSPVDAEQRDDPALIIVDMSDYYVKLMINEVDIGKIEKDRPAFVTLDALPDLELKGVVYRLDTVGTDSEGVITYDVYVGIRNPSDRLRPNMTANVDIETRKQDGVLTVPNSAIKPYRGGKAVRMKAGSASKNRESAARVKYVPVETGIVGPARTEIVSGVKEGDKVVIGTTGGDESSGPFGPPEED